MKVETRKQEIINMLTSCSRPTYKKEELLTEMLKLQNEMLEVTFSKDHAELANLRLWDIEHHLEQVNNECGGAASNELERFRLQSKKVCNLIKAEFSGNNGEYKTFKTLEYLKIPHTILKNVEFNDELGRTELDAIVITPFGITIVEVKNTSRNIFINEQGNYYRTGDFLHLDCNIASKMAVREEILRTTLAKIGYADINIQSVIVFTNPKIEIQNKYSGIKVCFIGQLNHYVEDVNSSPRYTGEEITAMANHITESSNRNEFTLDFDADMFKNDFATVVAVLENASSAFARKELELAEEKNQQILPVNKQYSLKEKLLKSLQSDTVKKVGSAAAVFTASIVSSLITKRVILYGGTN